MSTLRQNGLRAAALLGLCSLLLGCSTVSNWMEDHNFALGKADRRKPQPKVARVGESLPIRTKRLGNRQKADVQMSLACSFERQEEYDRAIDSYKTVIRNDPGRADAHHRLAVSYDQVGKFAEAEKHYREALRRRPKEAELLADIGYSYYLQEKWKEAETYLRRAAAVDPELARAHTNLGLVLGRSGRDEEALVEFHLAGCSDAEARENLAHALKLDGRSQDARYRNQIASKPAPEALTHHEPAPDSPEPPARREPVEQVAVDDQPRPSAMPEPPTKGVEAAPAEIARRPGHRLVRRLPPTEETPSVRLPEAKGPSTPVPPPRPQVQPVVYSSSPDYNPLRSVSSVVLPDTPRVSSRPAAPSGSGTPVSR